MTSLLRHCYDLVLYFLKKSSCCWNTRFSDGWILVQVCVSVRGRILQGMLKWCSNKACNLALLLTMIHHYPLSWIEKCHLVLCAADKFTCCSVKVKAVQFVANLMFLLKTNHETHLVFASFQIELVCQTWINQTFCPSSHSGFCIAE